MSATNAFLLAAAIAICAKTGAWLWQLRTRNAGMVDAVWAATLGAIATLFAAVGTAPAPLRVLLALMGAGWSLRLGLHLWRRNRGGPEDWRYARFRERWGARADRNMFWFFQFQNVFTLLLAASAFLPVAYRGSLPGAGALLLAVATWLAAVAGEGIADAQLARFRADPARRGQVCRDGLWRWSRHPNYFFECVHWLAYVPLALGGDGLWLGGAPALLAPLVMALLLTKLSGVPLLEEEMARRKPGYGEYMRTTSALIPWPPRN